MGGKEQERILSGAALAFVTLMVLAFRDSVDPAEAYKIVVVGAMVIGGVLLVRTGPGRAD